MFPLSMRIVASNGTAETAAEEQVRMPNEPFARDVPLREAAERQPPRTRRDRRSFAALGGGGGGGGGGADEDAEDDGPTGAVERAVSPFILGVF